MDEFLHNLLNKDPETEAQLLLAALNGKQYEVEVDFGEELLTWRKTATACVLQGVSSLVRTGVSPEAIRLMVETIITNTEEQGLEPLIDD